MNCRAGVYFAAVCLMTAAAQADHVFVIKKSGSDVSIEKVPIKSGEPTTFRCNPQTGIVDVVFPVGRGGSGNLSRLPDDREIILSREADGISVLERGRNGKEWQRPIRRLDDLHDDDIRVSVISHEGMRRAFLIRSYEEAAADPIDLVVDLFAGRIPTQPGDYIIHTETYRSKIRRTVSGTTPMEYDRYLYVRARVQGGKEGVFVVDLGAGQTVVVRSFLPAGANIEKPGVSQYSSAGKEILKYAPDGATGATDVLGGATLADLTIGDLRFKNAVVAVMASLPELGGRHVDGILGLDLLRQAHFLTLEFGEHPSIRMAQELESVSAETQAVPFAMINSHIVVTTRFNNVLVATILDTGAPTCFLDEQAAKAANVKPDATGEKDARGLGGQSIKVHPAEAKEVRIGGQSFADVDLMVSPLPVFASTRVHNQSVGLLGNSTISRFARLEIDFDNNTIGFVKR